VGPRTYRDRPDHMMPSRLVREAAFQWPGGVRFRVPMMRDVKLGRWHQRSDDLPEWDTGEVGTGDAPILIAQSIISVLSES
jgi:hypothetical protein